MRLLSKPGPQRRSTTRRRGSVTLIAAVIMPAMLMIVGFGVDLSRCWLVQSRLQTALDAAALVAAREIQLSARNADAAAMFWSNFALNRTSGGLGYFGAVSADPTITLIDQNTVALAGYATLRLMFGAFFGKPSLVISGQAQSVRATTGMELALVLDNTGSMKGAPMQAVRDAATDLVNIVYGSGSQDTVAHLSVAIVPFTAEVNVGPSHAAWLAPGSLSPNGYANTSWMGCVLARHAGGHDADDATPDTAPFQSFLYQSTLNKYRNASGAVLPGDNDWSANLITEGNQANLADNIAVGPDLGCDASPILPPQASRAAALSVIAALVQTYRGGTFINLGLQAGWLTLSPKWRGWWGSTTLPLDYNTPSMAKIIVLMSDGNNSWYSWPSGAPDNQGDGDYTSYGRLSTNVLGLTAANATTYLNASMASMCTTIKSKGIVIYTVLFNHSDVGGATETLFSNCASTPQDYFLTPTAADLQAAFSSIGSQLASLRLSK